MEDDEIPSGLVEGDPLPMQPIENWRLVLAQGFVGIGTLVWLAILTGAYGPFIAAVATTVIVALAVVVYKNVGTPN